MREKGSVYWKNNTRWAPDPVINWVVPPPRMPVANEGLVRDSLLKMVHNPGGDCYWEGGQPKL